MTEISNNASLGLAHFSYFGLNIILSFTLPYIIRDIGPAYLYYSCGAAQVGIALFMFFCLKETAHLTDREKKLLYVPDHLRKKLTGSTN